MLPHQLISRRYPLSLIYAGYYDLRKTSGQLGGGLGAWWSIKDNNESQSFGLYVNSYMLNPMNVGSKLNSFALRSGETNHNTYHMET